MLGRRAWVVISAILFTCFLISIQAAPKVAKHFTTKPVEKEIEEQSEEDTENQSAEEAPHKKEEKAAQSKSAKIEKKTKVDSSSKTKFKQ